MFDPVSDRLTGVADFAGTSGSYLGYSATLLADGRVLIVGAASTLVIYDPTTGKSATDAYDRLGAGTTATLLRDGSVLILGGSAAPVAQIYEPK